MKKRKKRFQLNLLRGVALRTIQAGIETMLFGLAIATLVAALADMQIISVICAIGMVITGAIGMGIRLADNWYSTNFTITSVEPLEKEVDII